MPYRNNIGLPLVSVLLLLQGCAGMYFHGATAPSQNPHYDSVGEIPAREYWTGIVFNGNKIGFSHLKIVPSEEEEGKYHIHSEAFFRIRFLMMDKTIHLKSHDVVDDRLMLHRFQYESAIDESSLSLNGNRNSDGLYVTVLNRGGHYREVIPLANDLYPLSALNLYPLLHGLEIGRDFNFWVYNAQTRTIERVTQKVMAYETSDLYPGPAYKLVTRLAGQSMTSWLDGQGRPLLEMSLNGLILAGLEDEGTAKQYLAQAALNKNESLLNLSLIRCVPPIEAPDRLLSLSIALDGPLQKFTPVFEPRQRCESSRHGFTCQIQRNPPPPRDNDPEAAPALLRSYLSPTYAITAMHPSIRRVAMAAAADKTDDLRKIEALMAWMRVNISREPADVFSALDVLESGKAECQGHALLFAAFARTLGIPTRVVNGIVYVPKVKGFLYHSWNESFVGGRWLSVDPTFAQVPADVTHVKLVEGHELSTLMPLVDLVGKLSIRVLGMENPATR